jgi:chaperonin GroEL
MLIICRTLAGTVLTSLLLNTIQSIVDVVVVRAPGLASQQRSFLADVAEITGGTLISSERGTNLSQVKLEDFGAATKVMVTKVSTTIIPPRSCQKNLLVLSRTLRRQIELGEASSYEIDEIKERLRKLVGGMALIRIGGMTETEIEDRTLRMEDAMNATYAGVEEGSVPGGGNLLYFLSANVVNWARPRMDGDEFVGASILARALKAPLHKIIRNAGKNPAIIEEKINELNLPVYENKNFRYLKFGYNAETDEVIDLREFGILDPYLVAVTALKNAVSIASMVITTEGLVVQEKVSSRRR